SFGKMEPILKIPFFIRLEANFLHHIYLRISRRNLQKLVILRYNNIQTVLSFHVIILDILIGPVASLAKVVIIPRTNTGYKSPFFKTEVYIKMACFFIVCGRIARTGLPSNQGLVRK